MYTMKRCWLFFSIPLNSDIFLFCFFLDIFYRLLFFGIKVMRLVPNLKRNEFIDLKQKRYLLHYTGDISIVYLHSTSQS